MFQFESKSPQATSELAESLAPWLDFGDALLLDGPVGSGKSHFARSLIRALCGQQSEVPSPSFTLVQTYEYLRGQVWHIDLYRLAGAEEVAELGLETAWLSAIAIVEWPDRLGRTRPARHLAIDISPHAFEENWRNIRIAPKGDWPWLDGALGQFDA